MKQLCRSVFSLLLLAAVCAACNLLAAMIDTPALRENAADGCQLLCREGATPELAGGFRSSQADNFTAVLILKVQNLWFLIVVKHLSQKILDGITAIIHLGQFKYLHDAAYLITDSLLRISHLNLDLFERGTFNRQVNDKLVIIVLIKVQFFVVVHFSLIFIVDN